MPRKTQTQTQTTTPDEEKAKRGRAAVKTFAALPAGALTHEAVPDTEFVSFATEASRSDDQLAIDAAVQNTYKEWVKVGRPDFTRASLSRPGCPAPREKFSFPPEHTEAIQYMLDRAAQLYGLNVVKSPISRAENGNAVLHWSVKDRASRPRKTESKPESEPESGPESEPESKPDAEPEAVTDQDAGIPEVDTV